MEKDPCREVLCDHPYLVSLLFAVLLSLNLLTCWTFFITWKINIITKRQGNLWGVKFAQFTKISWLPPDFTIALPYPLLSPAVISLVGWLCKVTSCKPGSTEALLGFAGAWRTGLQQTENALTNCKGWGKQNTGGSRPTCGCGGGVNPHHFQNSSWRKTEQP